MLRLLTTVLLLHWAVAFSLLALACALAGGPDMGQALGMLGLDAAAEPVVAVPAIAARTVLSMAAGVTAILFWWALLTWLAGGRSALGRDVAIFAFAAATSCATLLMAYGAACGAGALFPVTAAQVAALLASYIAVAGEGRAIPAAATVAHDHRFRLRVQEAARVANLVRFARPLPGDR